MVANQREIDVLNKSVTLVPKFWNFLGLIIAYTRLNLAAQLEYRAAFFSQVVAMFLNDGVWVTFWVLFFSRFQVLQGWNVNDVITVWAISASGFGLAFAVCGNALGLARLIAQGSLTPGCSIRVRCCRMCWWAR